MNIEEAPNEFADYTDVERDLELILGISTELHTLETEVLGDGNRFALALRVAVIDKVAGQLKDIRDACAQALGSLMEDDLEHVAGVGQVSREHSTSTVWDKPKALTDIKAEVVRRVSLDAATGEQVQSVANGARLALDAFLAAVSPPTPTVGGCKALQLYAGDYRTVTEANRWSIKVVAD